MGVIFCPSVSVRLRSDQMLRRDGLLSIAAAIHLGNQEGVTYCIVSNRVDGQVFLTVILIEV